MHCLSLCEWIEISTAITWSHSSVLSQKDLREETKGSGATEQMWWFTVTTAAKSAIHSVWNGFICSLINSANAEPLFVIWCVSRREQEGLASQRVSGCKSASPKILTAGWRCVLLKWGWEGQTFGHVRAGVTDGDKERNENKDREMRWRKVSRCALLSTLQTAGL